jgi:hypothetical protein
LSDAGCVRHEKRFLRQFPGTLNTDEKRAKMISRKKVYVQISVIQIDDAYLIFPIPQSGSFLSRNVK